MKNNTSNMDKSELTPEGQDLWEKLNDPQYLLKLRYEATETVKVAKKSKNTLHLEKQLRLLQKYAENKSSEASKAINEHARMERYFQAESCKVLSATHEYYKQVITKLLNGGTVEDVQELVLIDDTTPDGYYTRTTIS